MDNYSASGLIHNFETGTTMPLPESPVVEICRLVNDENVDSVPGLSQLLFSLEKSFVGLDEDLASDVPIFVASIQDQLLFDEDQLMFNLDRYLEDPTLETFNDGVPIPGQPYMFSVAGLMPNDTFNFFLDERLVLSDTLDDVGSFTGSFVFPSDISNTGIHFLTAQDSTGEFAYSITCPIPEPTTILFLGFGLISLAGFNRRKKIKK